jgi:hypothetical protein
MDEFKNRKLEFSEIERQQTKLHIKYLEQRRKQFDYADTAQWILEDKNQSDLIELGDKLSEWSSKAKDSNKKQFEELILTLFRVQAYCTNLETLSKQSVAIYIQERKINERLESELRLSKLEFIKETSKLKTELDNVKKELEFINRNG